MHERAARARHGVEAGGVDDPEHTHDLRDVAAGRPFLPHVDLRVPPHNRQALRHIVVGEPPELDEVVERWAHPAAERILAEALALGEGVVARVTLVLGDNDGDSAQPEDCAINNVGTCYGKRRLRAIVKSIGT